MQRLCVDVCLSDYLTSEENIVVLLDDMLRARIVERPLLDDFVIHHLQTLEQVQLLPEEHTVHPDDQVVDGEQKDENQPKP